MPQSRQQRHAELQAPEIDPWIGEDDEWVAHPSRELVEKEWETELRSTRGFFRSVLTFSVLGLSVWALLGFAVYRIVVG